MGPGELPTAAPIAVHTHTHKHTPSTPQLTMLPSREEQTVKPLTLPAAVGGGRHTFPPPASQEKDNAGSASAEAYSVGQRLQAFVDELKWLSAEGNFASLLVWSTQHDEEPTKGCRSHSSAQVTQPLCRPHHPPPPPV